MNKDAGGPATDLERWQAFADAAGVVYSLTERMSGAVLGGVEQQDRAGVPVVGVVVKEGAGPKNVGYDDFFTYLVFTADGALVELGAWEGEVD